MFCLDFLSCFAVHYFGTRALERQRVLDPTHPLFHYTLGAAAGLSSAIFLYPIDLVRLATVPAGQTTFAYSTIPFAACYLGLYFTYRDPSSTRSRVGWACVSGVVGAAVELPFDKAKWGMFRDARGIRGVLGVTGLRLPLAAGLLLCYDEFCLGMKRREEGRIVWRDWKQIRNEKG